MNPDADLSGPTDDSGLEARLETCARDAIGTDPAHDIAHIRRVVRNARRLLAEEGRGNPGIVVAAAWLHDLVLFDKSGAARALASAKAAETASELLAGSGHFSAEEIDQIHHAIHAHSYSAGMEPRTIEARIVQDADRLDALGAVGIARCFIVGGRIGASIYHEGEPVPQGRTPDDRRYMLDHFEAKLFRLPGLFRTDAGRREAARRVAFMRDYVDHLAAEAEWA